MSEFIVLVTVGNSEEGEKIARALVEERLAACVNIVPGITSIYRWDESIERDSELLLLAKTTDARLPELKQKVKALHSYEVPEILALPVTGGSEPYLAWLRAAVE
jgi:periplasmic divalent cation tolerance protein